MTQQEAQQKLSEGWLYLPEGVTEIYETLIAPRGAYIIGAPLGSVLKKRGSTPAIGGAYAGGSVRCEDFTIDGSGEMVNGIVLYGSHNRISSVTVQDHTSDTESFALLIDSLGEPGYDNLIEDCTVKDFQGTYNGGIVIASQKALVHGTIRSCTWIGPDVLPHNVRPPYGCMGASLMEDCTSINAMVGTYTEGCIPSQIIHNNLFYSVRHAALRVNLTLPQRALVFENNFVELVTGAAAFQVCNNPPKVESMIVRNNTVIGGKMFDINNAMSLRLEDNVGTLTDFGSCIGSGYAQNNRADTWRAVDGKFKIKLKTAP